MCLKAFTIFSGTDAFQQRWWAQGYKTVHGEETQVRGLDRIGDIVSLT